MNTTAWVAIACSIGTQVFAVIWWLVRRPIGRLDRLEAAVFGDTGVNMRLTKFLTNDDIDKRMGAIDAHLRGVSEEGQKREERILSAIQNNARHVSTQISEMRTDVRQQSERIDDLMRQGSR